MKSILETDPPRMSEVASGRRRTGCAGAAWRSGYDRGEGAEEDSAGAVRLRHGDGGRSAPVSVAQPISARPDTVAYRTARFVRRNRARVALAIVAV